MEQEIKNKQIIVITFSIIWFILIIIIFYFYNIKTILAFCGFGFYSIIYGIQMSESAQLTKKYNDKKVNKAKRKIKMSKNNNTTNCGHKISDYKFIEIDKKTGEKIWTTINR